MLLSRLQSVGVALAVLTIVRADYDPSFNLTLNPSSVNECDEVEFSWSGGVPPYTITAVHFASIIQVPAGSSGGGSGSYKWICSYPKYNEMAKKDQTIFFYMTDSRGAWTLASPLYTIGNAAAGMNCTYTQGPQPPWYFSILPEGTTDEFKQCDQLTIDWSITPTNHTPVTVVGAVPNSSLIFKTSANDIKQLNWNVNVQAGADFVMAAWDSEEAQGGVTQVIRILPNENTSCLDANTLNITAPALENQEQEHHHRRLSTGVLAGIIAGSVVAGLLLVIVAVMLVLRRRKHHRSAGSIDLNEESDPHAHVSPFSMPPDRGYTAVARHDTPLGLTQSRSGSAMPLRSSFSTEPSMQLRSSVSTEPSMQLRSSFSTQPSMHLSEMQTVGLYPTLPTSRASEGSRTSGSRTSGRWSPLSPYTELPPGAAFPPSAAAQRPLMGGRRRSSGKGGYRSADLYLSDGGQSDPADAATAPPNTQYRFHEDGGRIGPVRAPPVVDMPPLYNAAWQEEPEQMYPSLSPPISTPSPTSLPTLSPPAQSLPVHMLSVQSPSVQSLSAKSSGQSHSHSATSG